MTKDLPEEFRQASVVVVDDNPANVALLGKLLRNEGYENVTGFTDPRLVKPHYEKNRVDIVLLDIRMPHMDGFEVMAALKSVALDDYLPVLVLTAQTDIETRHRALAEGAKDFLNKPFEHAEALNRIYNILDVRLMHNKIRDHNVELEKKVQARTSEIEETRLDVIRRLGRAAEYRDNETGFHVIRMSKYCECLALAAGMSEHDATVLLNASPMHDVGKIGIPDAILLKPGKLDQDEWEVMKSHSAIGGEILSEGDSELMHVARIVALTHHENWDGTGYPGHVDPAKEANAQKTRLESNTTTLAAEYARQGKDWETELSQRAKEKQLMAELGLLTEPQETVTVMEKDDDEE